MAAILREMENVMKSETNNNADYVRLNEQVLRPGDIILVTQSTKTSARIRLATMSDVSHAMVYVEDRSVIDARPGGVRSSNTQRLFLEAARPVHALRLRTAPTAAQLKVIERELRGKIGTRYSERQAALTLVPAKLAGDRQQFCSRLVAQAYAAAGIALVGNPDFCSPGSLKRSKLLEPIADATVPVTPEEIAFFESREDIPELMHEATNSLLDGARTFDPKIEDLDDLNGFIVDHPEHDEEMCRILVDSGYLDIWKIEQSKNPWQYDLELMNGEPDGGMAVYCWEVLRNEGAQPNRYIQNRAEYDSFARQFDRGYFRKMVELYDTLATLHVQRVDVAQRWLEAHDEVEPADPASLVPHSEAWFAALAQWSPNQAMMTRAVVAAAGRPDVCSVCGDQPVRDHRLVEGQRPAGGVDTLRLCGDCVSIRRDAGELFVPFA